MVKGGLGCKHLVRTYHGASVYRRCGRITLCRNDRNDQKRRREDGIFTLHIASDDKSSVTVDLRSIRR